MKYDAVLDRIEEGKATILVESIGKEYVIEATSLPKDASEGMWLVVEIDAEQIIVLDVNLEKTAVQKQQIGEQMERIRKKSRGSKFQRR